MGLDQNIMINWYIGKQYEHRNVKLDLKCSVNGKELPINVNNINSIQENVLTLRKCYWLHNLLTEDQEDLNGTIYLSSTYLISLLEEWKDELMYLDEDTSQWEEEHLDKSYIIKNLEPILDKIVKYDCEIVYKWY
jgi:hypothetical protein